MDINKKIEPKKSSSDDDVNSDLEMLEHELSEHSGKENISKKNSINSENVRKSLEKSLENQVKNNTPLNLKIWNFINKIQKLIDESKERYDLFNDQKETKPLKLFETDSQSLKSPIKSSLPRDFSSIELEESMDKIKESIVKEFNKYHSDLREMKTKIMNLEKEKNNLQSTLKSEVLKVEKLENSHRSSEFKDTFKSLATDKHDKRCQVQVNQLKDDNIQLEKDLEDLQTEKRLLKKQVRSLKTKNEELSDDVKELEDSKSKIESENKSLKKQVKELKNRESSSADDDVLSDLKDKIKKLNKNLVQKDETIEHLKEELKENQDKILETNEALENAKSSLSEAVKSMEKEAEIEGLTEQLQSTEEEIKFLKEKYNDEERNWKDKKEEMENNIKKKDIAMETVRKKLDAALNQKKDLENLVKKLEEDKLVLETENKKNKAAMTTMRDKIKDSRSADKELEKMQQVKHQLASKEKEVVKLEQELGTAKKQIDDKLKECEGLKKDKTGLQEEIANLKLLQFKK